MRYQNEFMYMYIEVVSLIIIYNRNYRLIWLIIVKVRNEGLELD